jgi:hypothetical protein
MPALSDILRFQRGQLFITPVLPKTDLSGKIYAITGANTGLGLECAKQLFVNISSRKEFSRQLLMNTKL